MLDTKVTLTPLRVFLCYCEADKDKVKKLYYRLSEVHVSPWFDDVSLLPGQDLDKEIADAIRNSHVILICLSRNAITKEGYVQKEINYALDVAKEKPEGSIFLIPLRLEECGVPDRLKKKKWLDYFGDDISHYNLLLALRKRAEELKDIIPPTIPETLVAKLSRKPDPTKEFSEDEYKELQRLVLKPDKHAELMAEREPGGLYLVVGNVIEIQTHPYLGEGLSLDQIGWHPSDVQIINLQEFFDSRSFWEAAKPPHISKGFNGIKFCLVGKSPDVSDDTQLRLEVRQTDFYTVNDSVPKLEANPDLRETFGRIDPRLSKIPHSINLEHLARFRDGHILSWFRENLAVHNNRWSFTGEEQLKPDDFSAPHTMTRWMSRTCLEEVFPLRGGNYDEKWTRYESKINSMRIWSLFIEEESWNYDLFGVYNLALSVEEYVDFCKELRAQDNTWDREGKPYVVSRDEIMSLLINGECVAVDPFNKKNVEIVKEENLHRSSRYRLFRLMKAIYRDQFLSKLREHKKHN